MILDGIDSRILFALDIDTDINHKEFAKELGISRQSLEYRIKKLLENKVIKKFYALVDFFALGYWQYKVYIKLQNRDKERESEQRDSQKKT